MQRRDAILALGGAALAGAACSQAPVAGAPRRSLSALTVRPAGARGHGTRSWLDSRHSFSFADYHDPAHMSFGALRVLNEDHIAPSAGFPMHPHRDMEIVTYVLAGELEHRDSMGNGSVIRPGEVQRMTAGTGVRHSEFNASGAGEVHLLQIWFLPSEFGLAPGYEQTKLEADALEGRFHPIATPGGSADGVRIRTAGSLLATKLAPGQRAAHQLARSERAWLQVARGEVRANGTPLRAGDGAHSEAGAGIEITATRHAEVLLFALA